MTTGPLVVVLPGPVVVVATLVVDEFVVVVVAFVGSFVTVIATVVFPSSGPTIGGVVVAGLPSTA